MATVRRRKLPESRRRIQDDGEDEESVAGQVEDSHSEISILSEADDNADADDSELSEQDAGRQTGSLLPTELRNGHSVKIPKQDKSQQPGATDIQEGKATPDESQVFSTTQDVEAMRHGLVSLGIHDEVEDVEFKNSMLETHQRTKPMSPAIKTIAERGRSAASRQDDRHGNSGTSADYSALPFNMDRNGESRLQEDRHTGRGRGRTSQEHSTIRGRGRGRGSAYGASLAHKHTDRSADLTQARWDHDLHASVEDISSNASRQPTSRNHVYTQPLSKLLHASKISPSRTIAIGTVLVRVLLPAMESPVCFSKTPVRQHTRLPDIRPPLRRDKPVRISLPNQAPKYIFPSIERSFIFIPRAQRPNQNGNRVRGRHAVSQGASRRTSLHGGSVCTPSATRSRRSSLARDGIASPTGSAVSRPPAGAPTGPSRPTVRLPASLSNQAPPMGVVHPGLSNGDASPSTHLHGQTLPMVALQQQIPMYQPRPQKAVSVATIESPVPNLPPPQVPSQQEQQPFHQQMPVQVAGSSAYDTQFYGHSQHVSLSSQPGNGTPLSNIPESAINAQPFQPVAAPLPAFYTVPYENQPLYYYGTSEMISDQHGGSVFMQPAQYYVPMVIPAVTNTEESAPAQSAATFAHESNGMVYYYDSAQLLTNNDGSSTYDYGSAGQEAGFYSDGPPMMFYYTPQ